MIVKDKKRQKKFGKSIRRILLNNGDFKEPASSLSTFGVKGFKVFKEKRKVRIDLLERRSRLTFEDVNKNSKKSTENLLGLTHFKKAQRIALYFPIKNEVRTERIFEKAKECGKELYFPLVVDGLLEFHKVEDLGELRPGRFGIPEPSRDATKFHVNDLDMIVVPGVAFDHWGRRLGYGKGYYDRSLIDVNKERLVGLAYGFQILTWIPTELGDKRVGLIITEKGIIFTEGGG